MLVVLGISSKTDDTIKNVTTIKNDNHFYDYGGGRSR